MKKIYYFLGAALLAAASASALVSSFPTTLLLGSGNNSIVQDAVNDDAWTARNYTGTTTFRNQTGRSQIWTATENVIDAWFVTPAVEVTEGNEYTFRIRMSLHASDNKYEHIAAYVTPVNPVESEETAAAVKTGEPAFTLTDYTGNDAQLTSNAYEAKYTAETSGKVYLAINCSGTCYRGVNFYDLVITEKAPVVPVDPDEPGEHECAGKPVPYISDIVIDSKTFDEGWTTIDANANPSYADQQWKPNTDDTGTTGFGSNTAVAKYTWSSSIEANDFLISPAVHLVAGTEYKIQYGFHTKGSDKEDITIYATTDASTPESIKAGTIVKDYVSYSNKEATTYVDSFTPTKTGDYHFAIWAHSPKSKYDIYFRGFNVLENKFNTNPVSNLTATVAPNRELKVTLSWSLPTQSTFGDPFTDDQTVEKVEIYRDGGDTAIATLEGAVTSFEDTADTGLTSGKHTYTVRVFVAGTSADANVGPTAYAGPVMPSPLPVDFTMTTVDDYNMWSVLKTEEDTNSSTECWVYYANSYNAANSNAAYYGRSGKVEDAWLFTPPFTVEAPGYYRLTIDAEKNSADYPTLLDICVGTAPNPEAMEVVKNDMPLERSSHSNGKKTFIDFYAAEAGTYYTGFHANMPERTTTQIYYIYGCAIAASKATPSPVQNLKIASKGVENIAVLTWTNADTNFAGMPATNDYNIEIYIGDDLAKTIEAADVVLGEQQSAEVEVAEPGKYTFTVKTVGPDGATTPEAVTLTSPWIGDPSVPLPYSHDLSETDETTDLWDVIDADKDNKTWATSGYAGMVCQPGTTNSDGLAVNNDYLLSPVVNFEQGYYLLSLEKRGGYSSSYEGDTNITYHIGLVDADNFDADNITLINDHEFVTNNTTYETVNVTFNIETPCRYRVAIALIDPNPYISYDYQKMTVRKFDLRTLQLLPAVVSELTVIPGEDYRLEATVSWLNPTVTNIEGVELTEGDLTKAVIYRDGEVIAEVSEGLVPGVTSTYVDTEVPSAGIHTYKVVIFNANGCSEDEAPEVKSKWIGGGLAAPYTFEKGDFEMWTLINLSGRTDSWGDPITWRLSSSSGLLITSTSQAPDDWAVSPTFELEDGALYKIDVAAFHNTSWPYSDSAIEVHIGDATGSHTTMTKLCDVAIPESATFSYNAVTKSVYLQSGELDDTAEPVQLMLYAEGDDEPADPQTPAAQVVAGNYTFGIHAAATGDIGVKSFAISIVKKNVVGVDAPSTGSLAFADGIISFDGLAEVEVYNMTGMLIVSQNAEGSFSLRDLANGAYLVRVTPENGVAATLKVVK